MHLTIIGGGRAAWAFGSAWRRAGWTIDRVVLRARSTSNVPELLATERASAPASPDSDVILVAVTDDALPQLCSEIARRTAPRTWLFHASGFHDSSLFGAHERSFSLHPLRALPPPGECEGLADTLLVFEGRAIAEPYARELASRFGARIATLSREEKPTYHAAAVLAANLVAAQLDVAAALMSKTGIGSVDVRGELARLAQSAILNWSSHHGADRFTGPIARGDVALVRRHLEHLRGDDDAVRIYRASGLALCRRLLMDRPNDESLRAIEALLSRSSVP